MGRYPKMSEGHGQDQVITMTVKTVEGRLLDQNCFKARISKAACMKPKRLALLLIIFLVFAMLTTTCSLSRADNHIPTMVPVQQGYIKNDGTITPSTLPIERTNDRYTLTGNILNYSLKIERNNIVFDGHGFSMTLPEDVNTDPLYIPLTGEALIQLEGNRNITIMNVTFSNYFNGISVKNSTNILLLQNSMSNGHMGIYIFSCTNCYIIANQLTNHMIRGLYSGNSSLLNIAYNTISRNGDDQGPIFEYTKYSNITRNNFADNNGCGLTFLGASVYNNIFENNFMNNKVGVVYQASNDLSLENNLYNNYWNNNEVDLRSMNLYGIDYQSEKTDQAPKQTAISTEFDPACYPLPFPISFNVSTDSQNMSPLTMLWIAIPIIFLTIVSIIYVAKKRKQTNRTHG
jgi:hypothetical protein